MIEPSIWNLMHAIMLAQPNMWLHVKFCEHILGVFLNEHGPRNMCVSLIGMWNIIKWVVFFSRKFTENHPGKIKYQA